MKYFENDPAVCHVTGNREGTGGNSSSVKRGVRHTARAAVALLLVLAMLPVWGIFAGADGRCDCGFTPIICIHGHQDLYKFGADGSAVKFGSDDDELVDAAIDELIPLFAKTLVTQNWDEYCDRLVELITPIYEPITYDGNYNIPADTGPLWSWTPDSVTAWHSEQYAHYDYEYDHRLPLQDVADDLHEYIQLIKEKTGHDKVILLSRCAGTNLLQAYLYKYERPTGYSDLEKILFICGNMYGADFAEALFSGTLKINSEAAYRWLKSYDIAEFIGEDMAYYLHAVLDMLEQTYADRALFAVVNMLYGKIKDRGLSRILKLFHGITPGFVAFVYEHYDEYKNYIFQEPGDTEKYAYAISKFDEFHDIQLRTEDMLKELDAADVKTNIFAYYGDQTYPLMPSASLASDRVSSVADQTFGATASTVTGALSCDYINSRIALGLGGYISPDRQIDASTGLYPDTTWFIKNGRHQFYGYGGAFDRLFFDIARQTDATVRSDPRYPQFLNFNETENGYDSEIIPAREHNDNDIDWAAIDNDRRHGILNFFRMLFVLFKNLLSGVVSA